MGLSHLDESGRARMVDVGHKAVTRRSATAAGRVRMSAEAFALVRDHAIGKGDVLGVARLAGIAGAKRTADLIPLCHPLGLDAIEVEVDLDPGLPGVSVRATARVEARTGVEMEALTAVTVACLAVYDMVKAVDRGMVIEQVELVEKSGGQCGSWSRQAGSNPKETP